MRRPLLTGAVVLGLGALLADGRGRPAEVWALLIGTAILLTSALRVPPGRASRAALAGAALGLGAAAAQVEALQFESTGLRRLVHSQEGPRNTRQEAPPLRLTGRVRGDALEVAGRLTLLLDLEAVERRGRREAIDGRARIEIAGQGAKPRLLDGDRVALWARLRATAGLDGIREGVAAHGFCKSVRLVDIQAPDRARGLRWTAARMREGARQRLVSSMPPGTERGLVLAMALGDRSEIDGATAEAFRASGTYHVLALSGAQVALVAGLIVGLLRWLVAPPWLQGLLTTAAISSYAAFVGGDVPVVRAVLMAAALLLGRALERDTDAPNLLGLAALVLLVQRPACVRDVGFQLSFGATLGILLLALPLVSGLPRLPLRAELALAASVSAQVALTPILAATFHRLAPAAVILNLAAVPLSTAVLLSGLGVIALSAFGSGPAGAAGVLAGYAARALRLSGDLGPLAPWLDLRVSGPSLGLVALHACGLALVCRGRRGSGLVLLLASHTLMAIGPLRPLADGRLHMTVIDVGQGDSVLLRSPSGRALLVDAGGAADGRFDAGERRVAPELWQRRVRGLDALVVTHAHADHIGGARFLLRAFRVAETWEGPAAVFDPIWRGAIAALAGSRAVRRTVFAGVELDWDGVRLSVLAPRPPSRPPLRVRNEDSVVVDVGFGEVHLLLTGDLAGEAERALSPTPAQVLKVPHHGSSSSSSAAFVAAVRPRLAIVSCGASGAFGSARPEVLQRYFEGGALVLRTDRDGSVDVATDGKRLWVRTAGDWRERRIH